MSDPIVSTTSPSEIAAARRRTLIKLVQFVFAGLPMFALAIPLNWLLVTKVGLPKSPAYAIVLVAQSCVNFFICRWFIFRESQRKPLRRVFAPFVSGLMLFRLADWGLYSLLVSVAGLPYVAVQLGNAVLFSLLKFGFARRMMDR